MCQLFKEKYTINSEDFDVVTEGQKQDNKATAQKMKWFTKILNRQKEQSVYK